MANERQILMQHIISNVSPLKIDPNSQRTLKEEVEDTSENPMNFPIKCRSVGISVDDPSNYQDDHLPAISYGYGTSANNEAVAGGTQLRGETLTFLINIVFVRYEDDDHLANTAARWHDTIAMIVPCLDANIMENGAHVSIRDARLTSVTAFSQGLSDREFLQFAIEIDWTYPIRIQGEN